MQHVNSKVKTRPSITELIRSDDTVTCSDFEIATLFNNYFSTVFTNENIASTPAIDPNGSLPISESIDFTPDIVLDKIMNMHNNKSPGRDGWPISIIKSVGEFIAIPLSIISSESFNSGTLPHDWKNSQVTPIHKKGARNNVSNYRPVSLTSIFGKLMETIVKDHLISNLISNNLLSAYQFGFVPDRSCTTQLLHVLDYFTKHLDEGYSVDVIYLDFQKAFDTVPHQRLIQKIVFSVLGYMVRCYSG